jgi:hypothetical protein
MLVPSVVQSLDRIDCGIVVDDVNISAEVEVLSV